MSTKDNVVITQTPPTSASPPHQQVVGLSEIVQTIKDMAEVADKRASTFLLGFGGALTVFALACKVKLFGLQLADISKTEFVAFLVVCLGCLFSGAYVRMLQERLTNEHELRLLQLSLRYALRSQEKTVVTALQAQLTAQLPVTTVIEGAKQKRDGG